MTSPAELRAIWFVVAAFNEGQVIEAVARDLAEAGEVAVVDDGSLDDTADAASRGGAHVIRHLLNRGQGAALQTGIVYALRGGATHVVTFDADGQHRLEDALAMVERMDRDGLDVVLGSRFLGETVNMGLGKRLVLKAGVLFSRLTTGLPLTDTHNGLRVFSRVAAEQLRIRQDRMAHASEILSTVARRGWRWAEAPVTILYTDYSKAKGQRISNSVRILEDLFMQRVSR